MNYKKDVAPHSLGDAIDGSITGPSSALNEIEMDSNIYEETSSYEVQRNCSYNTVAIKKRLSSLSSPSDSKGSKKKAKKHSTCLIMCFLVISTTMACVAASLSLWSFLELTKQSLKIHNCSCVNSETELLDLAANNSSYVEDGIFSLWNENITQLIGTLQNEVAALRLILQNSFISIDCGPGLWKRIFSLNMSDSSQQCPSEWEQFSSPTRSCGRPNIVAGCNQVALTIGIQYSRVCGRAISRGFGTPDAFETHGQRDDENYVDGLSVTHSSPRQHIWTFAGSRTINSGCPCNGFSSIPSFVGDNYFCDFLENSALWDGEGCVTSLSCCTFNSPPWFSTQLPAPTFDDIDVRICTDENTMNENIYLELMELYVQ